MLTLPNMLTLSRILAVPILVWLLWKPSPLDYAITFLLYSIVGVTDYIDGYLARAQGQISRLGQFLDPIAPGLDVHRFIARLEAEIETASDALNAEAGFVLPPPATEGAA